MKKYLLLLLVFVIFPVLPGAAQAATLSLNGPLNTHVGTTFNVQVYLSTHGEESANAVSGSVIYPPDLLSLVAISKGGSIISLWPSEPTQSSGSAHFEGVILNPGWSGTAGTVITLTFQAKAIGSAALAFSDANVLANDGNATPILSNTSPTSISIAPALPAPFKPTPPVPHATPVPTKESTTTVPAVASSTIVTLYQTITTPDQFSISYSTLAVVLAFIAIMLSVLWYIFGLLGYEVVRRIAGTALYVAPKPVAGAVVLNTEGKMLVVYKHTDSWSFPKGGIEQGESALESARREIARESGVIQLEFVIELGSYERYAIEVDAEGVQKDLGLRKHTIFLFKTGQSELRLPAKPSDVIELRWVPIAEALTMFNHPEDNEFLMVMQKTIEEKIKEVR